MNRDTLLNKLNSWYVPASTALGATAIAIVMTRLVLGISAIENNPITALGLETTGSWQLIGIGSIAGLTLLLYGLKLLEESNTVTVSIPFTEWEFEISTTGTFRVPFTGLTFDTSSVPRAGVWSIAAISIGDVALNTQHLLTNGLPESFLVGELVELSLILGGASVVALGAIKFDRELLTATARFGRASRSVGRPQTMAIMFCILVVGSMIGPHVGFQGPVGTAEAADTWTEESTWNPTNDIHGAAYNADGSEIHNRVYDGTDQNIYRTNPSDGTVISSSIDNNIRGFFDKGDNKSFAYYNTANGYGVAAFDSTGTKLWEEVGADGGNYGVVEISYGEYSDKVFVTQSGSAGTKAVNPDGTAAWTHTADKLYAVAEHPDTGAIYGVTNANPTEIVELDQSGNEVNRWSLGEQIHSSNIRSAEIDTGNNDLYISDQDGNVKKVDLADPSAGATSVFLASNADDGGALYNSLSYEPGTEKVYFIGGTQHGHIDTTDGSVHSTSTTTGPEQISTYEDSNGDIHAAIEYGEAKVTAYNTGDTASYTETVSGTVKSCDATTYSSNKNDCDDTPVANAQGQVVAVQESALSPDAGETYEEAAQEAIEDARNPLPDSWDADLQLTGSDGYFRSVEGEYVSVHSPGEWGMAGWSEGANLGEPALNPRANERIVLSAWDTSKDSITNDAADRDLYGATVKRDIVVERVDHTGDVLDTQKLSPNKKVEYGVWNTGKTHHVVETSLQAGVYRVYPDGSPESAYTIVVGDADQLAKTIESDLRDRSDALSEHAKNIQSKVDDGTFVVKQFETDSNGDYSVEVPADTVTVHVQAYKMDGETLTTIKNPSIQDMRDEVENTDYNGSVSISPGPKTYDVPSEAGSADARVIKFSSPPNQGLDSFLEDWNAFMDKLENESLSDAGALFTDTFDLTQEEAEERKEDLEGVVNGNNDVQDRYEELREDNDDLREDIANLEQALREAGVTIEADEPESSVDTGGDQPTVNLRQAFDTKLNTGDVLAVWKSDDGTSTTIPDEYVSVDRSLTGNDEVVVSDYPVPTGTSGGHISVTVVSDDGVAKGGDHVANPDFDGDLPDIRSVDASSLRPGVGETVTMTPRMDSTGHTLQSATVYDPSGNTVTSSVADGTIEFTPESQGAHTVRYTLTDSSGNEFVETAKVSAQESSNAWPASVRAVEGTSGTYALAGDELRDANVEVTDNGNTVEITALVPEDATPSEVHVYLDEANVNTDGDIEVRVLQGTDIDTASSVDKRVGVTLHTQRLQDDSVVYRSGGLDGGDSPIPVGESSTGGERAQKSDHTSIQTYTDQSGRASVEINNDPGWVARQKYDLDVLLDGINLPVLAVSVPTIPMAALADTATVTGAVTAPLGDFTAAQGVSA